MEALIIVLALFGLVITALGIALTVRLWTVLGMHRQAMHALHQELSQRRLERQMETRSRVVAEESGSPHSIWRTGPSTGV